MKIYANQLKPLANNDKLDGPEMPGIFPFTRGPYATMVSEAQLNIDWQISDAVSS